MNSCETVHCGRKKSATTLVIRYVPQDVRKTEIRDEMEESTSRKIDDATAALLIQIIILGRLQKIKKQLVVYSHFSIVIQQKAA